MSFVSYHLPVSCRQLSVLSGQSSVVNHHSTFVIRQLSIISCQFSQVSDVRDQVSVVGCTLSVIIFKFSFASCRLIIASYR